MLHSLSNEIIEWSKVQLLVLHLLRILVIPIMGFLAQTAEKVQ